GHGGSGAAYPNPAAHRDFLAAFERRTGVRFVELLVPPLADTAANAVRRPVTTGWCTGDPNTPLYYGPAREGGRPAAAGRRSTPLPPVRHLPLDRITLRVAEGAEGGEGAEGRVLIAEADGVRLLPVHHATRAPVPPYDRLLRLLASAGHPATTRMVRLDGLAGAFPGAARVPRLTVGGLLVVSPAQWRLPRAALWRATDPEPAKVAALAALRRSAGLPRFGYLRTRPGAKPLPMDLAALPALQAIERLSRPEPGADLVFEEALPAPHQAAEPFGVAAQLLLRLPHDRTPEELAERAAAAWCGAATGLPGACPPSEGDGGGMPGRTPHHH
ncbi:lantibiotic dehydratase, partial [Streptomyces oryzae]